VREIAVKTKQDANAADTPFSQEWQRTAGGKVECSDIEQKTTQADHTESSEAKLPIIFPASAAWGDREVSAQNLYPPPEDQNGTLQNRHEHYEQFINAARGYVKTVSGSDRPIVEFHSKIYHVRAHQDAQQKRQSGNVFEKLRVWHRFHARLSFSLVWPHHACISITQGQAGA
jgi:hypothetical protein